MKPTKLWAAIRVGSDDMLACNLKHSRREAIALANELTQHMNVQYNATPVLVTPIKPPARTGKGKTKGRK